MLAVLRTVIVIIYSIFVCFFGCIYCLLKPRDPRHVAIFSRLFGRLAPIFGLQVQLRKPKGAEHYPNAIYICNHQNNFDMITAANMLQSTTVTVGKTSLLWIPFFGLLYWLSGNFLIDRRNGTKAYNTIVDLVSQCKTKKISFWIFPEGTRSYGRGLLPFKIGAFYAAIEAGVPIIPIVVSNTHQKIKLNRLSNGLSIVEMLTPIDTRYYTNQSVRKLANDCRDVMLKKLDELNTEVEMQENRLRKIRKIS
ncbi:1-acyl-sn-glycerol-3-phosphate acyltransferase [Candidatus Erwinia haradaeae]|uniref:1-acyl-sn-glycerol-3-phosphate acyltransferase n=1 Tax=Candidatus Erwinia haradaeae TaxID=1922217 RepID=A0A451DKQ3_9GAMM|nr:1-acylglycerol-3-phosphate O-acyltransferase [Candidatus Erwinia haradaeae]VFP87295.1 1-acyl-sn-glycerol-3-phosphate acyltransferase [Candidatus Erwinia haradaeae]